MVAGLRRCGRAGVATQRISAILGSNSGSRCSRESRTPAFARAGSCAADFLLSQDLAHCPLGQLAQAWMPGGRSVLPGMCGEQPGGPQLVGITQLLGLSTRQCHQPGFRLGRDDRIASRTRPIIERRDHPQFRCSLQTACHGLLRHLNHTRHGICRRVVQIGQNDPRPFDPARRLGTRPRNLQQTLPLLRIRWQRNHPASCCH